MEAKPKFRWFDISAHDLYGEVGRLRPEDFDKLPFGTIRLNHEGVVLDYNMAEATFARRDPKDVIGKRFFDEVAPCTKVQEFHGSFVEAAWRGEFDHSFRFTFRFPFGVREASLRLFSDGRPGGIYIFVDPVGEVRKVAQGSTADASARRAS